MTALTDQVVTLLYLTPADSRRVNLRHQDIRQVGIYKGLYATNPSALNVTLSPGVCEISDGDYQIKVDAPVATTGIPATLNQYLVLRWAYTGDETADVVNAVCTATPLADDVIVAYIGGSSGALTFNYGDSTHYYRTQPNTLDLQLKVEPPDSSDVSQMKPRVRAGRFQLVDSTVYISDQQTPSSLSTVTGISYALVYVDVDGTIKMTANSGVTTLPLYGGKTVLAEITLPSNTTAITASMIKDVRCCNNITLLDEDTFASNSNTKGATQQSIKAYVDSKPLKYKSSWFAVVANASYPLTHNLGTTNAIFRIQFSLSSDGSNPTEISAFFDHSHSDWSSVIGGQVTSITSSTCIVKTLGGANYNMVGYIVNGPAATGSWPYSNLMMYTTGYYRILGISLD